MGDRIARNSGAEAAATSATASIRSGPATARRRAPRAAKERCARSSTRRSPSSARKAFRKARSSGSPAAPASRSAPSIPTSTARRRCSRRWSATCPAQVRDHVAPALAGATDALDGERRALASFLRFVARRTRKSTGSSTRPSSSIRTASASITRRPPSASRARLQAARTRGEVVRRTRPLATEVEAWAIMGMNVFLGLRFGVWGKEDARRRSPRAPIAMLRRGLQP